MNKNNYVIIMAGGAGTRFWPFSRSNYPKQFHDVLGTGRTLLQQTADRFAEICMPENIYVVTSAEYRDTVQAQLPQLTPQQILLEPVRRNTAPCIAYACYKIGLRNPDANLVVAPADHIILKEEEFVRTIEAALAATQKEDILVTLGIKPSRPDTGYGYIQYIPSKKTIKKVKTFTEKPYLELAQKFLESGDYVWNAGIFVWNVKAILKNFDVHMPDVAELFEDGKNHFYRNDEEAFINKVYSQCKNVSIDIGIMEKAGEVYVVLSDFGWSDLGTWKSLYDISPKDESGNVLDGNTMTYETKDCIIKTPKDRLVVTYGLEGFIVAEYDNVLLICKKDEEQRVRDFVADAKNKGAEFV
jgi:mannose-1-phosphate guanylyltransferase